MRRSQAEADDVTRRSRGKVTTATARDRVGYHHVWSRWSASYDEVTAVADRLLRARPQSLTDLSMIFSALEWVLQADGVIVDQAAERHVRGFSRALRGLAAGP